MFVIDSRAATSVYLQTSWWHGNSIPVIKASCWLAELLARPWEIQFANRIFVMCPQALRMSQHPANYSVVSTLPLALHLHFFPPVPFCLSLPCTEMCIGTFSEAATSSCARQWPKSIVLACAQHFKTCNCKWQWLHTEGSASAMTTPISTSDSKAFPNLFSYSLTSHSQR